MLNVFKLLTHSLSTFPLQLRRLNAGKDQHKFAQQYVARAKPRIALQAAVRAWGQGVPWAEALSMCERAIAKASAQLKPLPKGKARAKQKAKAKAKSRP